MDQLFTNSYFLNFVWTLRFRFILRRVRKTVTCCLLPTFLLQL